MSMYSMYIPALTSKVKLGVLPTLPLFNGALDWQRQPHAQTSHVGLDLVQVLLAKMLDSISHGIRLKDRHSL